VAAQETFCLDEDQPNQDFWDVFAEESSRGRRRRPLDAEQRRVQAKLRREAVKALREKDERSFTALLQRAGIRDESPEFAAALKLFRELCARS
jgi:hypothetical protein